MTSRTPTTIRKTTIIDKSKDTVPAMTKSAVFQALIAQIETFKAFSVPRSVSRSFEILFYGFYHKGWIKPKVARGTQQDGREVRYSTFRNTAT